MLRKDQHPSQASESTVESKQRPLDQVGLRCILFFWRVHFRSGANDVIAGFYGGFLFSSSASSQTSKIHLRKWKSSSDSLLVELGETTT